MGHYQPDIIIEGYWVECTHGKAPRISAKIRQANRDLTECDPDHRGKIPMIVSRRDRGTDYVTVPLDHFLEILEEKQNLFEELSRTVDEIEAPPHIWANHMRGED